MRWERFGAPARLVPDDDTARIRGSVRGCRGDRGVRLGRRRRAHGLHPGGESHARCDFAWPAAAYAGGPAVVRLNESEFTITPANPRVTGTHQVAFEVTNNGSVTHSFAVRTPFGVLKSEPIPPGQKGGLTVDLIKPGVYAFYCPLHDHRQKGMQGSVVVQSS